MKSILLHIHDDKGQEARLQAALDLVRSMSGRLVCLQVTPYSSYIASDPFGGVFIMPDVLQQLTEQEEAERVRIEARLAHEGVAYEWLNSQGDIAQVIVDQARMADLVVLSRAIETPKPRQPLPLVGDVALHARTPVLAVLPGINGLDANGPMLVAWNGSSEAAAALKASLPLLRQASRVDIVTIEDMPSDFPPTDACVYLARHGIKSEIHQRRRSHHDISDELMRVVQEFGPACLVMGAYGHSRVREYLLGSVTRHMLGECPVPLLLAH